MRSPRLRRPRAALRWTALALLVGGAQRATAQARDTLVVGTYAYPSVDRAGAIAPLAEVLAHRLGRPTRVLVVSDPLALVGAVRDARVDVAVTNTFGYLLMAHDAPAPGVAVATFRVPPGVRTRYGTVIVTRAGLVPDTAGLATAVGHLAGWRVGLVSPGSTTGNLVPRLLLARYGVDDLETRARAVTYAGTHAGAFALLRDGAVEVAALATEELERQLAALPEGERARYRTLWQSPDILLGPVVVRAGVPEATRRAIADALVGLEARAPAAFRALRGGWTEARLADALVPATDATYDPLRRLFGDGPALGALLRRHAR